MITDEIQYALDSADPVSRLGDIVGQFRSDRDAYELFALIESDNAELIGIGAYILNEIVVPAEVQARFAPLLKRLLAHEVASVRLTALLALFPTFESSTETARKILKTMASDPNPGVRIAARAARNRFGV